MQEEKKKGAKVTAPETHLIRFPSLRSQHSRLGSEFVQRCFLLCQSCPQISEFCLHLRVLFQESLQFRFQSTDEVLGLPETCLGFGFLLPECLSESGEFGFRSVQFTLQLLPLLLLV